MNTAKNAISDEEQREPELILACEIYSIIGLHPHECVDLTLYLRRSSWITARNKNLPETTSVKVYIEGLFPCHIQSFSIINSPKNEYSPYLQYSHHKYKLNVTLESPFSRVGITPEKAKLLDLDNDSSSLSDIFFTDEEDYETPSTQPNCYCSATLVTSTPELTQFGKKHGVFNIEDKIRAYYDDLEPNSTYEPDSIDLNSSQTIEKALVLHNNTSEQLLDLIEANNEFWLLYDPSDPYTAPTKEHVVNWLLKKGYKKTLADKMDTILRDGRAQPGGRPQQL